MLDRESLLRRAELLRRQRRFKDAEKEIAVILRSNPEDVEALIILGHCKLDNRQYDEAISILKNCLQYDSNKDYVFYLLAFVYYQKNENKTALGYLHEAISIFPYNAGYFALAAHIQLELKEYQAALDTANVGLEIDATSVSCLNARSTALFRLNKKEAAYETINEALSIDPENFSTHTNYGWHHLEKGKHKEAQKHFREALRINPTYGYAKQGYKAALKSNLIFYKWLLQVNLWMSKQKKNFRIGFLLGIWLLVRIIATISENSPWRYVGLAIIALYFVAVLFSWLGSAFANLYLLSTPHGRYILTHNEVWGARLVGISLATAFCLFCGLYFYDSGYLFVPFVIAGLSIVFNEATYPITPFKGNGRIVVAHILMLLAIICCISALMNMQLALFFAIVYSVFFVGFIWTGSFRNSFL